MLGPFLVCLIVRALVPVAVRVLYNSGFWLSEDWPYTPVHKPMEPDGEDVKLRNDCHRSLILGFRQTYQIMVEAC